MPHTIQLSDDRYIRLVEAARSRGFEIKPGAGSQLGEFIEWLLDCAPSPMDSNQALDEIWSRFFTNVLPHVNELARALVETGKGLNVEALPENGWCLFEQFDL